MHAVRLHEEILCSLQHIFADTKKTRSAVMWHFVIDFFLFSYFWRCVFFLRLALNWSRSWSASLLVEIFRDHLQLNTQSFQLKLIGCICPPPYSCQTYFHASNLTLLADRDRWAITNIHTQTHSWILYFWPCGFINAPHRPDIMRK